MPQLNNRLKYGPGAILGYDRLGRPIRSVAGGSSDEFEIEPDGDDGSDPADDSPDAAPAASKYEPPSQAEWVRTQNSLNKANASAKQKREALSAAEKRVAELEADKTAREAKAERDALLASQAPAETAGRGKGRKGAQPAAAPGLPDGVLTPTQVKQQIAAARKETESATAERYRGQIVRSAAAAELAGSGVPKAGAKRLVALLDLDEVEVDENGEIVGGLDDQIAALREELPQLFAPAEPEAAPKKRTAPRPPRIPQANGSDRAPATERPRSTAEIMAQQVLGTR